MPRPGMGSGSDRMSSGHNGSRMSSGHHASPPGSAHRAGMDGGGFGGFGDSDPSDDDSPFGLGGIFGIPGMGYPSQSRRYRRRNIGIPIDIFTQPRSPRDTYNLPDGYFSQGSGQYNPQGGPSVNFDNGSGAGMPPSGGSSGGSNGGMGGPFQTPQGGGNNRGPRRNGGTGMAPLFGIIAAIILFAVIFMMPSCTNTTANRNDYNKTVPASTYNREKIKPSQPFDPNCVEDQIGWVSNQTTMGKNLRTFYDKTGVQPEILFAKYNPRLSTDEEKDEWAKQYFDEHVKNEDAVLYVYFADQDTENTVGFMDLVIGKRAAPVMDKEAQEIFWTYLDQYWYSDRSTDDAVVQAFNSTADRIMTKSTTQQDVTKWVIIAVIVILIIAAVVVALMMMLKRKREHEDYVERMVTTPLDTAPDPLLEKYDHNETKGQ